MPADFRDELQSACEFILETQNAPQAFSSYHWMISTSDDRRFADSSAMCGGPFDMSDRATKPTTVLAVADALSPMVGMPHIYVADFTPPSETLDAIDLSKLFVKTERFEVLTVVAGGRRTWESSGWTLKLVFIGLRNRHAFISQNEGMLAVTKPLLNPGLFSKRPSPS